MKRLYVFGNEYLAQDSLARVVAQELKGVEVIHCRSPDEVLDEESDEIVMLDVVKGIDKTIVIADPEQIKTRRLLSMHDFDVGFFLNLMSALGLEKTIKVIGIPQEGNKKQIITDVERCL